MTDTGRLIALIKSVSGTDSVARAQIKQLETDVGVLSIMADEIIAEQDAYTGGETDESVE